ncbi:MULTISPECIES: DUF302 domain-containing protein [Maribellus]|uniref:DUF302 domain-containing protein n=1 Tax=Maribellus comscasis TaxID=2681766 RepID=A0A6I6JPL7_9BACT|nr:MULTISPECIES: DUF302 domain-containing protein [Maribellus]MCG6187114.1 DUF302 domain-containing protein [Maribellus maritimus]QGY42960.1 DUF302 domain-containing protein [Maribellus comscasis]
MKYYIEKVLNADFETAVSSAKNELKKEGFGILTEINIDEKFKEKLGVENYNKYRILGACNPALAYDALEMEDKIGTMLPCNVIVKEMSPDKTEVAAISPIASMQAVQNDDLKSFARLVNLKLEKAIAAL